ncbi:hypothetical protein [Eubacterium ramulus]
MRSKKIPQLSEETLYQMGKAEKVQQHQLFDLQGEVQSIKENLTILENLQSETYATGRDILNELEGILEGLNNTDVSHMPVSEIEDAFAEYEKKRADESAVGKYDILKTQEIITHNNWDNYYENLSEYGNSVGIHDDEDPFLSALSSGEYRKLDDEINGEFERKTSIRNKLDLKFLAIAIALEVAKGLLFPIIANKAGYGESFDPDERLDHNDKSIKDATKKAQDDYRDKNVEKHGKGKWIEILYRTVPYDITSGTGSMENVNLHGGAHRLYTLGHDPILGWIFGTVNILTDVITISPGAVVAKSTPDKKIGNVLKFAGIQSYRVTRTPKMQVTPERVPMLEMFREGYQMTREDPMNLPVAIFVEGQHLKSDVNTKMGLPVPMLEVFNPDFASKLYSNNYDALCFARDMKIIGLSATVSIIFDIIIGLIHGLYYDPQKDGSRDLYEVRTRKILLIANTIGTSSNLIFTYFSKNVKNMDIGGLLVTLSHLFCDTRFFLNVKKEFVEKRMYEKIEEELKQLEKIEEDLLQYGLDHRQIYKT